MQRAAAMSPIPVTVIGGYLGAGKTTLVNNLLRQADGLRLTVLVNDFGELPIDQDLIEGRDGDVLSVAGGCICCSYGSDLMASLVDVGKWEPRPDHLLIEASGVSLPLSIAQSVSLVSHYGIEGVIVLADAETVRAHGQDRYLADTIAAQLTAADLVILNKIDLVSAESIAETWRWLAEVAPDSRVIEAVKAEVPFSKLLTIGINRTTEIAPDERHQQRVQGFSTASFEIDRPIVPEALAKGLAAQELGLIRSKGFVRAPNGCLHIIQTVGARWTVTDAASDDGRASKIVCIAHRHPVDTEAISRLISAV